MAKAASQSGRAGGIRSKASRQQAKPANRINTNASCAARGIQGQPSRPLPSACSSPPASVCSCAALLRSSRRRIGSRQRGSNNSSAGSGARSSRPFCHPPAISSNAEAATISSGSRITPARAVPPPMAGRSTRIRSTRCQIPPGRYLSRLLRTNRGTRATPCGRCPIQSRTRLQARPLIRMLSQVNPSPSTSNHQPLASSRSCPSFSPWCSSATVMKARLARVIQAFGLSSGVRSGFNRGWITTSRTPRLQRVLSPPPPAMPPGNSRFRS